MTDFLHKLLNQILMILPLIALCLLSVKVNLQKTIRSRQFLMPVLTLVYTIAAMCLIHPINEWLLTLIKNIPIWIAQLSQQSWMPDSAAEWLTKASDWITAKLAELNMGFWIFFIANTVIMLVYIIFKKISISFIKKLVKDDSKLHIRVAERFYEYFSEKAIWCIKESYIQARAFLKTFYYSAVVISAVLMLVSSFFYSKGLLSTVYYPVFGILIVGELCFYLDGLSKKEYSSDILGEDENAYRTVNYSLLRQFLRTLFGDKLLVESTNVNDSLSNDLTNDEIIRDLEKSEDPKTVCFAEYFKGLNSAGFELDHNYIFSSLDLLNGKSILFNNPFYNDLIPYAFYPINRTLLSHRKVLVILGRHGIEDDITQWIEKGISAVTNIPYMWKIGKLSEIRENLDIGILTRSDILDIELHNSNTQFFEDVGFCVIIEPSKLISTAQVGLHMIARHCMQDDNKVVYCMCDQNCDGLVDSISHIVMTSITEVSATKKHLGTSSYMCWETDDEHTHHRIVPNISRYLGLGTELSVAALKNQISTARWYGGEAFPVTDMSWISNQYYFPLMKYANQPTSQNVMNDRIRMHADMWSASAEKNNYLTVEDESNNMFEVLRDFSTRATEQGFINVISSEYLLKDYMADNASIFENDAKAIPYIVADFVRTRRNTIMKLLLMMSTHPVSEIDLGKELSLIGIKVTRIRDQLWHEIYMCYSNIADIMSLPTDYIDSVKAAKKLSINIDGEKYDETVLCVQDIYNIKRNAMETAYSIKNKDFISRCVSKLRSASYVAEDEKGEKYYLGSELNSHIYQKYLPGQFFTFNGKYYEMQYLTADGQILVRRAADHINGRPSYRQIRTYTISQTKPAEKIGSKKNVSGLKISREYADICVATDGYFRMKKFNDFASAKRIEFEGEKSRIPCREYLNKEILKIELPSVDGQLTNSIRYTITVLFNEVFRTLFAENHAYIAAVTDTSFIPDDTDITPLTYSVEGDGISSDTNCIYIIEDSQLDLGLISTVERNIFRIFRIIEDYLKWHFETLEKSLNPPPEPEPAVTFGDPEKGSGETKKGFFGRIADKIKSWFRKIIEWFKRVFGRKKKVKPAGPKDIPSEEAAAAAVQEETPAEESAETETPVEESAETETPAEESAEAETPAEESAEAETPAEESAETETPAEESAETETPAEESAETEKSEQADTPESTDESEPDEGEDNIVLANTDGGSAEIVYETEDDDLQKKPSDFSRKPYHERYYMLYGKETLSEILDISAVSQYIEAIGFGNNPLEQARKGQNIAEQIEASFVPNKPGSRYCDFCGDEICGVEYETLADGRDRCIRCGRTAIKTGSEFIKLFEEVKRNMEAFYGISINTGIKVEMVNSKKLHKRLGKAFVPTPKADGRVLGVAIKDKNGYSLLVENGSPRMASMLTMAHELTHIWQYLNWDDNAIKRKYGKNLRLQIYEGMAKWAEIQYAYLINEPATAKREEITTAARNDEYGHGFIRYRANYPLFEGTIITGQTPFMNPDMPLDMMYCGAIESNASASDNTEQSEETAE